MTVRTVGLVFLALFCLLFSPGLAQRGKIIRAASTTVMDPNSDGFVSKTSAGFSNNGAYFVDEFEFKMFGIPKLGGDVTGDNIGPSCGITDLIPDSLKYSVYAVKRGNNLIFRFRVGDDNPSVESWSILIDTDGKIGNTGTDRDPNYRTENPGFEIDITLIKRNNAGVYVYNINGREDCPSDQDLLLFYPIGSNFQISIADQVTCGDPDYFYDYYVPIDAIVAAFNAVNNPIETLTDDLEDDPKGRFVAVTNVSATCAMAGNIADISGVDNNDPLYSGCNTCAFLDLVSNQCPSYISDIAEGGLGFEKEKVTKPAIDLPIRAGQTEITGTTVESNIYVQLSIFTNIGTEESPAWSAVPRETKQGYATGTVWSFTLDNPLIGLDSIVARTKLTATSVPCGSGGNNTSSTSVTIVEPNDKPVAINQTLSVQEDPSTPLAITLTGSDPDNDPITFSIVPNTGPLHGSITGSGVNWSYTPFANYFGPDAFSFNVSDGIYDSTNVITIDVTNVNDAPVVTGSGMARVYTTVQSSIIIDSNIGVTDIDDTDMERATVSITGNFIAAQDVLIFTNTPKITGVYSNGVLTLTGTATKAEYAAALATVRYGNSSNRPTTTTRTVSFIVNDGALNSAAFNKNITFMIDNFPPDIDGDDGNGEIDYETNEDTPLTKCLTFSDPEGNAASITSVMSLTNHGTTVPTGLCFTYTPTPNFNGEERVRIIVCDNGVPSKCDTIIAVITVKPVNDNPVAQNDAATTNENTPITFNILSNDSDIDNALNPSSVILSPTNVPGQGTFVSNGNGTVTFTPFTNFSGSVVINYTVKDISGGTSNSASITANILPNGNPVAFDDSFTTPEGTVLNTGNVLTNDVDAEGDALSVTQFIVPGNGTPVAAGGTGVIAGIGTIRINADGTFVFTPIANYNNSSPVLVATYTLTANGDTDEATVSIRVTDVNSNPDGEDDDGATDNAFSTPEDVKITLEDGANILANDTDPEGDVLSVTQFVVNAVTHPVSTGGFATVTIPAVGIVTIYSDGRLTFNPVLNYNGTAPTITYTVSDGDGGTNTAQVEVVVTPVNDTPVASNYDNLSTAEDTPYNFCIAVSDIEGNAISIGTPGHNSSDGTSTLVPTLVTNTQICFLFTPQLNFNGTSEWQVTICDNGSPNECVVVFLSIVVTPRNDAPVAMNDSVSTNEDVPTSLNVLLNDSDIDTSTEPENKINPATVDLNPATVAEEKTLIIANKGTFTVNNAGLISYAPYLNFDEPFVQINYTVKDFGGLLSNPAFFKVKIMAQNDPPIFDDPIPAILDTIPEDSTLRISRLAFDPEGSAITYEITNLRGGGSMPNDPDPDFADFSYRFSPEPNYNGESVWELKTCDDQGACTTLQFKIPIMPVNDKPVAKIDSIVVPGTITSAYNVLGNDAPIAAPYLEFYDIYQDDSVDVLVIDRLETYNGSATINNNGGISYTPSSREFQGMDSVRYWIKDSGGLTDSALLVIEVGPPPFRVYNAVSPDGDGLNDYWRIDGIEKYPNNKIQIFDRFNNLVYETNGYANKGDETKSNYWYGQSNHGLAKSALPEGTYFYSIRLGNGRDPIGGFIVLKRK